MTYYSTEAIAELDYQFVLAVHELRDASADLVNATGRVSSPEARTHLLHGASRRCRVLASCISVAFEAYPPDADRPVDREALDRTQIAIHAFMINLFGLFDNLAWAFLRHHGLVGPENAKVMVLPSAAIVGTEIKFRRNDIGLFQKSTKDVLPIEIVNYLDQDHIKNWVENYLIFYRDSLAHRIPLYIIPAAFTQDQAVEVRRLQAEMERFAQQRDWETYDRLSGELEAMGRPAPWFVGDWTVGKNQPVPFHEQLLSDARSTALAIGNFLQHWQLRR
jgi:hypothetical protein